MGNTFIDPVAQPDWSSVLKDCKAKIKERFSSYQNSWQGLTRDDFWLERIEGEFNELVKNGFDYTNEQKMAELVDIINICAMYYTNLKLGTRIGLQEAK